MANKYPFSKIGDAKLEFISIASDKNWDQYKDTLIPMKKALNQEYKGKMIEEEKKLTPESERHYHRGSMLIKIDNKEVGFVVLKQGEIVNMITEKSYAQAGTNKVDNLTSSVYYGCYTGVNQVLNDVESDKHNSVEKKEMEDTCKILDQFASFRYLSDRMVLLDTLYVKPEYRGYGVATRVYQKLFNENWCAGVYVSYDHYKKYDWTQYCDSFSLILGQNTDPEKMMLTLWDSKKVPSYKGLKLNDKQLLKEILFQQKMVWKNNSIFNVYKGTMWLSNTLKRLAVKYKSKKTDHYAGLVPYLINPVEVLEGFRLNVHHTPQVTAHCLPTDKEIDLMTTNSWTRQKGSQLWDSEKNWALPQLSYKQVSDQRQKWYGLIESYAGKEVTEQEQTA